jgi:hypothetical protein
MQKGIKLPLIGTITVAILGLMIGTSISVNVQQATAANTDNEHGHSVCNPDLSGCTGTGGFVTNSPSGHINCNLNDHRDPGVPKCNSH